MIKQMIISMFIVSLIVANGVIGIYLYSKFQKNEAHINTEIEGEIASNEQTSPPYIYALTDRQIDQAIQDGKSNVKMDDFFLPIIENSGGSAILIQGAEIITPYYEIMRKSNELYLANDKSISSEEAKNILNYEFLTFFVRIRNDVSWSYDVHLIQEDEIISPHSIQDSKPTHNTKTVQYRVENIDFAKKASLKVYDRVKTSDYVIYEIDFSTYIK